MPKRIRKPLSEADILRRIWTSMIARTTQPNAQLYRLYGGRGIGICDRWLMSFEAFKQDMGYRPTKFHSIDRIDNDGDYEPSNCRWATVVQQGRNRRTNHNLELDGVVKTLTEWSEHFGIHIATIKGRLRGGWDVESALTRKPTKIADRPREAFTRKFLPCK